MGTKTRRRARVEMWVVTGGVVREESGKVVKRIRGKNASSRPAAKMLTREGWERRRERGHRQYRKREREENMTRTRKDEKTHICSEKNSCSNAPLTSNLRAGSKWRSCLMRLQNLLWTTLMGGMICCRTRTKSEYDQSRTRREARERRLTSRFFIPFKNFFEALSV